MLWLVCIIWAPFVVGEVVTIDGGQIRGQPEPWGTYYKGIPYASVERFALPQPVTPWKDVLDLESRPLVKCPQPDLGPNSGEGQNDEDCLVLNVYQPQPQAEPNQATKSKDLLPVMVWFHGGGFLFGSITNPKYNGSRLSQEGVVVVTVNYRLGLFSGLTHYALGLDNGMPSGSLCMYDQREALRWIQRNIEAFNGDPNSVTIFGESSGASSVLYHIMSEKSHGLFHKAILQSYPERMPFTMSEATTRRTLPVMRATGCANPDEREALKCLKESPMDSILEAITVNREFLQRYEYADNEKYFTDFGAPIRDGSNLPNHAQAGYMVNSLHPKDFARVPLMIGTNSEEASIYVEPQLRFLFSVTSLQKLLNGTFNEYGKDVYKQYRRLYPKLTPKETLVKIITHAMFTCPASDIASQFDSLDLPVYVYQFSRNHSSKLGAFHGMEIPYVFGTPSDSGGWFDYDSGWDESDYKLSSRMVKFWTNFAKSGNPGRAWQKYSNTKKTILLDGDGEDFQMKRNFREMDCRFWKKLRQDTKMEIKYRWRHDQEPEIHQLINKYGYTLLRVGLAYRYHIALVITIILTIVFHVFIEQRKEKEKTS